MVNKVLFPLIIISLFMVFLLSNKNRDISKKDSPVTTINISVNNCNAQKETCDIETDEFQLSILFDEHIYYLTPFNLSIINKDKNDVNVKSIRAFFKMKNMDMGINRFILKNIKQKNNSLWQGKALLPVCVTGRSDWLSEIEVITQNNKYLISLPIQIK